MKKKVDYEKLTKDMNKFANAHPELDRNDEEFKLICMMYGAMKQAIENA
jgi:hypothetical protein